ncbi:hypothetical protein HYALB_00004587 [Hymenoscyphus albidus]|uniref:Uncharacterized protein n=1 Tax=Hymenoscyphus albidus TaxID=595503 RepID=A0A9N9QCG8_9HELO|nr:hypothetical protein HYALB_00004587 [Hymenoscyphus albidus]
MTINTDCSNHEIIHHPPDKTGNNVPATNSYGSESYIKTNPESSAKRNFASSLINGGAQGGFHPPSSLVTKTDHEPRKHLGCGCKKDMNASVDSTTKRTNNSQDDDIPTSSNDKGLPRGSRMDYCFETHFSTSKHHAD